MVERVPVIVLNWNGWDDTKRCLQSLAADPEVTEVWLVDNGSSVDRTGELSAEFPSVRFFRWDKNHGWAGGYNRALRVAADEGAPLAYLLNNDCLVQPGFLGAAVRALRGGEKVATVGSAIEYMQPPGFVMFDGDYHAPGERASGDTATSRRVVEVCGAGMLLDMRAFVEGGAFDERFFLYHEEAEWCRRLERMGWQCLFERESVVVHKNKASDHSLNETYYRTRNWILLMSMMHPRLLPRWWAVTQTVFRSTHGALDALVNRQWRKAGAISSGIVDGLRGRTGER